MAPDALIEEIDAAARAPDRDHATAPAGAAPAAMGSGWCYWPPPQPWPVRCRPKPAADERRRGGALRLELEDAAPYRLSRRHFAVVASGGGLAVRDDHSTLGTVVNGEVVGQQFPRSEAPLRPGENLVMAAG